MKVKESLSRAVQLYFSSVLLYGLGILLFRNVSYYQNVLLPVTQRTLLYIYLTYLIVSPIIYIFRTTKYTTNKPYLILRYLINVFRKNKFKPNKEERVALLFILVKVFYLPLMINFFFNNFRNLLLADMNFYWYSFIFTLMFTIDTFVFAIGYTFEFRSLKNVVKSVEPTLLGWAVAIVCYPPFNAIVGKYIPWGANDHVTFWNPTMDLIMKITIIFLLIIYVWATIALGPKASNLTNRGIVTKFPYSFIRHPAYISKNLIWWLTLLPVIGWKFSLGMLFWTIIYFLRAVTEERHLSQDPDYLEYKKKVKWRFIPKLY
jgi:protein-S-isoprenylcysteine O-methyltransferase Ste14